MSRVPGKKGSGMPPCESTQQVRPLLAQRTSGKPFSTARKTAAAACCHCAAPALLHHLCLAPAKSDGVALGCSPPNKYPRRIETCTAPLPPARPTSLDEWSGPVRKVGAVAGRGCCFPSDPKSRFAECSA